MLNSTGYDAGFAQRSSFEYLIERDPFQREINGLRSATRKNDF
jgi:hypothetical protein